MAANQVTGGSVELRITAADWELLRGHLFPGDRNEHAAVTDVFSAVRTLGSQCGCLRCNDLIDLRRLAEESVGDPAQVLNQRYIDEPDVHAPSVVTLNALGVGWAANTFMQYMVGLRELPSDFQLLRTAPVAGNSYVTLQEPNINPDCHVCGDRSHSAFGRGDQQELPTRLT